MKSTALWLSAGCVVALRWGVAVYGQERVTANVPFSFRTATVTAPAGHYEISPNFVNGLTLPHNSDTQQYVSILRNGAVSGAQNGQPRLVFRCNPTGRALAQIFAGAHGWDMPLPKPSSAEKERLTVVYFTRGTP